MSVFRYLITVSRSNILILGLFGGYGRRSFAHSRLAQVTFDTFRSAQIDRRSAYRFAAGSVVALHTVFRNTGQLYEVCVFVHFKLKPIVLLLDNNISFVFSKLLQTLDLAIRTNRINISDIAIDKTYMIQLVEVQHNRKAVGGTLFANTIRGLDAEITIPDSPPSSTSLLLPKKGEF